MHPQHGNTARHILESAVRFEPLKHSANLPGKFCSMKFRIVAYERSDFFNLLSCKITSAVSLHDVLKGLLNLWRRFSSICHGRNDDKSSGVRPLLFAQAVR